MDLIDIAMQIALKCHLAIACMCVVYVIDMQH